METKKYLESKLIKDHLLKIFNQLRSVYFGESHKLPISKKSAELGILILYGPKALSKNHDVETWRVSYPYEIGLHDTRFQQIQQLTDNEAIWTNHKDLLKYFFNDEILELVKEGWKMFPHLMYQIGHSRRSFRAPQRKELHFLNQLNFILSTLRSLSYQISLKEFIIYDNELSYHSFLTHLWAAAINQSNQEIRTLLLDIVYGRHEKAKVSRSIIKAMLLSNDEACWEAVEKLLLTAQRQEGLRQTILECLDETSFGAMKRMMHVVLDQKLTRFSSVVRAVDVWAGLAWEGQKESTVRRFLEVALYFLENPKDISKAISSKDNTEVYMALWAQGVMDVDACIPLLNELFERNIEEKTLLGLYFVEQINLRDISLQYAWKYVKDDSLLVFSFALDLLDAFYDVKTLPQDQKEDLYTYLEGRLKSVPKKPKRFEGKVFSWLNIEVGQEHIFRLMIKLVDFKNPEDYDKILAHYEILPVNLREDITRKILPDYYSWSYDEGIKRPALTKKQRDFAFTILKDRSTSIKSAGIRALKNAEIQENEMQVFEAMLKNKGADTRRSVIGIILKQKPEQIKNTVAHLILANSAEQRLAALDMLVQVKKSEQVDINWINEKAESFAESERASPKEQLVLDSLLGQQDTLTYGPENGYGLYNPQNIAPFEPPKAPKSGEYVDKTRKNPLGFTQSPQKINKAIEQLRDVFLENQLHEYSVENWNNTQDTLLLGNGFDPFKRDMSEMNNEERFNNYPLAEVWKKWFEDSGLQPIDLFLISINGDSNWLEQKDNKDDHLSFLHQTRENLKKIIWVPSIPNVSKENYDRYYYNNPLKEILKLLYLIFPYDKEAEFFVGYMENICANIAPKDIEKIEESKNSYYKQYYTWRDIPTIQQIWIAFSQKMDETYFKKLWQLKKWKYMTLPKDYPIKDNNRHENYYPYLIEYTRAFSLDLIPQDELFARIMKADAIQTLSRPPKHTDDYVIQKAYPFLQDYFETCRNRILEIELKRGDTSTAVTHLAQNLEEIKGIQNFISVITGLGKDNLHRGYVYSWGNNTLNKKEMLSTLLKRCQPLSNETQKTFETAIKLAKISTKRLIESAMYATQWLPYVESFLGWGQMSSAVWWLHAHTNAYHNTETESEISKYSSVAMKDFQDGAVDITWFQKVYKALGKDKWKMLYDAAKYVSDGTGHKRAMLYADVILGNTKLAEVKKRITEKRNKDYVRVFGLIPLNKRRPDKDLLERYQYLQQFKKESKKFGSQRQASEGLAVRIAMDNLARTAGYSDPMRLTWAMEAEEARQIIQNAQTLDFDGTQVQLVINNQGKSKVVCFKGGEKLKSIPARLKKEPAVQELNTFHKTLQNQYKRTRKSLEDAMIHGDVFSLSEIKQLINHPVVSPMLDKLVLKSENTLGFWVEGNLINPKGEKHVPGESLQIAHCTDLFESGQWSDYQRYCFDEKIQQPFKQIFRELYIPTEDELKEKALSRRYAGHQVQPKKTVALLKTQGWTVDYEEGLQKTFHQEGFIAKLYAMADWFTPSEVESPTLETVQFIDLKTWKNVPFESLDKRIFSEVMRDVDLVVSVAHVGDVDPEASQSSIELRRAIARETLRLFKIKNVEFSDHHAKIKGAKGAYSVHLGSAITHKLPGIALSILPVHSQHRGRMFLPFLDEDPKTAEIISKIILLAKDDEIQDPTILRQL